VPVTDLQLLPLLQFMSLELAAAQHSLRQAARLMEIYHQGLGRRRLPVAEPSRRQSKDAGVWRLQPQESAAVGDDAGNHVVALIQERDSPLPEGCPDTLHPEAALRSIAQRVVRPQRKDPKRKCDEPKGLASGAIDLLLPAWKIAVEECAPAALDYND
jgi:hypothetical protein